MVHIFSECDIYSSLMYLKLVQVSHGANDEANITRAHVVVRVYA